MARCESRGKEMNNLATLSCIIDPIDFPDGKTLPPVRYAGLGRCQDRGVANGGTHHPGCEQEVYPHCHGQMVTCDCMGDTG